MNKTLIQKLKSLLVDIKLEETPAPVEEKKLAAQTGTLDDGTPVQIDTDAGTIVDDKGNPIPDGIYEVTLQDGSTLLVYVQSGAIVASAQDSDEETEDESQLSTEKKFSKALYKRYKAGKTSWKQKQEELEKAMTEKEAKRKEIEDRLQRILKEFEDYKNEPAGENINLSAIEKTKDFDNMTRNERFLQTFKKIKAENKK